MKTREGHDKKRTACARTTAWPPASVLILENGRKALSVKT